MKSMLNLLVLRFYVKGLRCAQLIFVLKQQRSKSKLYSKITVKEIMIDATTYILLVLVNANTQLTRFVSPSKPLET